MLQNYNTYRILRLFFDSPTKGFQLREVSRLTKLGMPSVKLHIRRLEREKLIIKEKTGIYASYKASRNEFFKIYRINDVLLRLHESGLIEFLSDRFSPDAIVLFGSACRGEDIETSDIDLMVVAKEKDVEMKGYEKKIKRHIQILFEPNPKTLPKELLNNVINGIVVNGYLKVLS